MCDYGRLPKENVLIKENTYTGFDGTPTTYWRELGIVALSHEDRQDNILRAVRLIEEPNCKRSEIAFIVADPWQGLRRGSKMIDL